MANNFFRIFNVLKTTFLSNLRHNLVCLINTNKLQEYIFKIILLENKDKIFKITSFIWFTINVAYQHYFLFPSKFLFPCSTLPAKLNIRQTFTWGLNVKMNFPLNWSILQSEGFFLLMNGCDCKFNWYKKIQYLEKNRKPSGHLTTN